MNNGCIVIVLTISFRAEELCSYYKISLVNNQATKVGVTGVPVLSVHLSNLQVCDNYKKEWKRCWVVFSESCAMFVTVDVIYSLHD